MSQAWWLRYQTALINSERALSEESKVKICRQVQELVVHLYRYQADPFKDPSAIEKLINDSCQTLHCGTTALHECQAIGPGFQDWLNNNLVELQAWLGQWLHSTCGILAFPIRLPCNDPTPPTPTPSPSPLPSPSPSPSTGLSPLSPSSSSHMGLIIGVILALVIGIAAAIGYLVYIKK